MTLAVHAIPWEIAPPKGALATKEPQNTKANIANIIG
jgi:hypothetical protein